MTPKNNVTQLHVSTTLDLDADTTLKNLLGKFEGFVIAGYDKEGNEFHGSTYADLDKILWLVERCKIYVLSDGNPGEY